jgi:hypothetical protein
MVKPKKKHPCGIRNRSLLSVRPVFALRVPVDVGYGRDPRVAHLNENAIFATFVKVGV